MSRASLKVLIFQMLCLALNTRQNVYRVIRKYVRKFARVSLSYNNGAKSYIKNSKSDYFPSYSLSNLFFYNFFLTLEI